jgi:hypothetical protein
MQAKTAEKKRAIELRKQGKTYSEIMKEVPVAKATISLWLHDVGLAKAQKQRITQKRIDAQKRGAQARKDDRIRREKEVIQQAKKEIGRISKRELLLIGTALYWGEGSKAKPHNRSQGLHFGNSDAKMIIVYMAWLRDVLAVKNEDITLSLYIHENNAHRIQEVRKHWVEITGLTDKHITYTYFKKHNPKTKRRNTDVAYFGVIVIKVRSSVHLHRKVQGWTLGIVEKYGSL